MSLEGIPSTYVVNPKKFVTPKTSATPKNAANTLLSFVTHNNNVREETFIPGRIRLMPGGHCSFEASPSYILDEMRLDDTLLGSSSDKSDTASNNGVGKRRLSGDYSTGGFDTLKITSYDRNFFHIDAEKIPIGVSFRPKLEGLLRLFESS